MELKHVNESTFDGVVNDGVVIVDFFATWCGPCKMLGPVLEDYADHRSEVKIVKVDIDESEALAQRYGVMSVPTLVLFQNGVEIAKHTGFMPKELLNQWIEKNVQ